MLSSPLAFLALLVASASAYTLTPLLRPASPATATRFAMCRMQEDDAPGDVEPEPLEAPAVEASTSDEVAEVEEPIDVEAPSDVDDEPSPFDEFEIEEGEIAKEALKAE